MSRKQIRKLKIMVLSLEELMENTRDDGVWCELSDVKKQVEKIINRYE